MYRGLGDCREQRSRPLLDGFQGRAEVALGHGGVGGAGTPPLTVAATDRRCTGVVRLDAEAAPIAGGIQQGAARTLWQDSFVLQNTSCSRRQRHQNKDVLRSTDKPPFAQSGGQDTLIPANK